MGLNPIGGGLRTIHNGSNNVAKASLSVPAGGELTVPADVADQLQRDPAFKDGPATAELLASLAAQPTVIDNVLIEPAVGAEVIKISGEGVQDPASGDVPPVVVKPKKPAVKKG